MRVERQHRMHPSGHLMVGGILILIGFLFLLDTLGIANTGRVVSTGWPLILIWIGASRLRRADSNESRIGGGIWIFVGLMFLISRLGFLPFNVWALFWPVMLMSFGLYLVVRSRYSMTAPSETANRINAMAFMGAVERKLSSQSFEGGEVTAMMGGVKLDFRDAAIAGDQAVIEVFVWAGGVEIFIPHGWVLDSRITPVMAGLEDSSRPAPEAAKKLVIRGLLLMGGIEVKN